MRAHGIDFRCYVPRKECTDTFVGDTKSAICGALRERIIVLSKFGINDIWMRAHGSDSPFHIATILGISIDDWDILASHCGLFDASNRIKKQHIWTRMLQLEVQFRDFDTTSSKGDRKRLLSPH